MPQKAKITLDIDFTTGQILISNDTAMPALTVADTLLQAASAVLKNIGMAQSMIINPEKTSKENPNVSPESENNHDGRNTTGIGAGADADKPE